MDLERLKRTWDDLRHSTCKTAAAASGAARTGAAKAGQAAKTGAAKAGQSARIGAAKAGQTAKASAAKATQTAENVVTYTRLKIRIADLRGEMNTQLRKVGELVYATHRGNPTDSETMQQALQAVDELAEQIAQKERELAAIRGVVVCGVCGAANPAGHVYCTQCGQPLNR